MSHSKKILVVDDEAGIRKLMESVLSKEGYETHLAANGQEALNKVKETEFDLAILDILIPSPNGLEVFQFLRNAYPKLKVIIVSGLSAYNKKFFDFVIGNTAEAIVEKPFATGSTKGTCCFCPGNGGCTTTSTSAGLASLDGPNTSYDSSSGSQLIDCSDSRAFSPWSLQKRN